MAVEPVIRVGRRCSGARIGFTDDVEAATCTIHYSRAQVEQMWRTLNNINTACKYVPLPYFVTIAGSAPAAPEDAIRSAHHQRKRVKAVYYCCGLNYCSYHRYYVVT